jgi:hypothetical protein
VRHDGERLHGRPANRPVDRPHQRRGDRAGRGEDHEEGQHSGAAGRHERGAGNERDRTDPQDPSADRLVVAASAFLGYVGGPDEL